MKTVGKLEPNPIFKGLPQALKDPKGYKKVEKRLFEILKSDHTHKKPSAWMKCKDCQDKFTNRKSELKKIGFKSFQQYLEWRKIMDVIINKREINL